MVFGKEKDEEKFDHYYIKVTILKLKYDFLKPGLSRFQLKLIS